MARAPRADKEGSCCGDVVRPTSGQPHQGRPTATVRGIHPSDRSHPPASGAPWACREAIAADRFGLQRGPPERDLRTAEFVTWLADHSSRDFQETYAAVNGMVAPIEASPHRPSVTVTTTTPDVGQRDLTSPPRRPGLQRATPCGAADPGRLGFGICC